jgi:hypothetical protein
LKDSSQGKRFLPNPWIEVTISESVEAKERSLSPLPALFLMQNPYLARLSFASPRLERNPGLEKTRII